MTLIGRLRVGVQVEIQTEETRTNRYRLLYGDYRENACMVRS